MVFTSYEELKAAAAKRREAIMTLEVDLGSDYSPEYEAAKLELQQAKAMKTVVGGGFLGDSIESLEARVEELRPAPNSIWIQYAKLDLDEWAKLTKLGIPSAIDQYERVLGQTFRGLFGEDPAPEEPEVGWVKPEPLTMNPLAVSSVGGAASILPGPLLQQVVQSFMSWQNSGGEVSIRPTKSGLV